MNEFLSICLGVGLAAACGFRVFVPFLAVSLAARGGLVALAPDFHWITTDPALVAFGVATTLELLAYQIPWVDNVLDTVASPAAVVAGVLLSASTISGMDPSLRWGLALVAGGGIAGIFQGATALARVGSTLGTGGLANPLLGLFESGTAILMVLVALFLPVVALVGVIAGTVFAVRRLLARRRAVAA
ncbi:MAG: DUF4126 domain-containing protein [Candidatus Binatia bacterium]|nr:DUF4126 domain-containing protein [Candidatus Binatia bacterium]